jgi:transposase
MTKKRAFSTRPTANNSAAQALSAERRQCPSCNRKSALISDRQDWGDRIVAITHCRWCGWEKVVDLRVADRDD